MKHIKLAHRLLWRGAGGRSAAMLLFALIMSVGVVACLTLTTDRLKQLVYSQASHLLAGDALIEGAVPIPVEWQDQAQSQGLSIAQGLSFRAMLFGHEEASQLGAVRAVDDNFPLKGKFLVAMQPFGEPIEHAQGPAIGEVWLTSRLFGALGVSIGDDIAVGDGEFRITKALIQEPDNPQSVMGFAPRVLMHYNDVDRTRAIAPGSRVQYSLMLAGERDVLMSYKELIALADHDHLRWNAAGSGSGPEADAFQRINGYVLMVASLALLLGAVAIGLAANEFARNQNNQVALLKTLGLGPRAVLSVFTWQLLILALAGCAIGLFVGWAFHQGLLAVLANLIEQKLPSPAWNAWIIPIISGVVVLFAFAGPHFWWLRTASPMTVLRTQHAVALPYQYYLLGVGVMIFLVIALSGMVVLPLLAFLGLLVVFYLVRLIVMLAFKPLEKWHDHSRGALRLGLGQWLRYRHQNATQAAVFGLIFMVLLSVYTARTQLLAAWQQQVPEGAPNHFVFNIFDHQKTAIENMIAGHSDNVSPYYPMTRGRIVEINSTPWQEHLQTLEDRGNINYERELNLTWSDTLQSDNTLKEGEWWSPVLVNESNGASQIDTAESPLLVSIEYEYAKGAGVKLGDVVVVSLAGQKFSATVTNIRTLNWQSMRPNFFVIFNRAPSPFIANSWITSFYLPPDKKNIINALSQRFPSVTLIEVDQALLSLEKLIQQLGLAVEYLLLLIVFSAIAVLLASISITLPIRLRAAVLMRTFGASRKLIMRSLWVEFIILGFVAGLIASLGTELIIRFWLVKSLEIESLGFLSIWYWGTPFAVLVLSVTGVFSGRNVSVVPPSHSLKRTM